MYHLIFKNQQVITKYNKTKLTNLIMFSDNKLRKSKNSRSFERINQPFECTLVSSSFKHDK